MGFTVADVRAAVAELKERGVVFEEYDAPELKTIAGIADMDGRSAAWFKDTEGNLIEILERESPSLRAAIINPDKLARLGHPLSPLATRAPDRG